MYKKLPEININIIYFQGFDNNNHLNLTKEIYYLDQYPDLEIKRLKNLYPKNIIREKVKLLKLTKDIREKLGLDW